jgi:phospholipase C
MPEISRRNLIRGAAVVGGAAAAATVSASAAAEGANAATAPQPAGQAGGPRHGDIRDIKHVMILMQENRSFDHYFGSLKGVQGFGDKATIMLPGGLPVWQQPSTAPGQPVTSTQYPWPLSSGTFSGTQPPSPEQGAQNYGGTDHSWETQHGAWYGGFMNAWQYAKAGPTTLGFLARNDIPFHYALADAYTIGDAYHCSVLSATGPNRTFLWSGSINAGQENGTFVAYNGGDELGQFLPWESYPETLQAAGVSWKIYQGTDNYGDNGAQYFKTFADLDPSQGGTAPAPGTSVYYDNGLATVPEPLDPENFNGDNLANAIKADVLAGKLAQVTWVVTNQQYSEHPDGAPTDGAYYIGKVLKALAADPDVFNSTLVIIDFDENDGQFDHVPPPVPPAGTPDEYYTETGSAEIPPIPLPTGLGFRVPLLLVSPWTRGGWVTSEVSDHTSVIQFLEKWTTAIGQPAHCQNISAWRRSVCGDLTSAFDFKHPVFGLPGLPFVSAPVGEAHEYHPVPASDVMPAQETGTKPARALPYQPNASLTGFTTANGTTTADLALSNSGHFAGQSAHFSVYDNTLPTTPSVASYPVGFPGQYTVAPSARAVETVAAAGPVSPAGAYDITVIGPNRFLRRFTGNVKTAGATAAVEANYFAAGFAPLPLLTLTLTNGGESAVTFTVRADNYSHAPAQTYHVPAGKFLIHEIDPVRTASGWYDVTVTVSSDSTWSQRFTGHLENGQPSITG